MNMIDTTEQKNQQPNTRESFSSRVLTDRQHEDFQDLTKIMIRRVQNGGSYKDVKKDLAYGYSRSENIKPERAEQIMDHYFKAQTGISMYEMYKHLDQNHANLTPEQKETAIAHIGRIEDRMMDSDKISFNRALSEQSASLADHLNITDHAAKSLIKDAFEAKQDNIKFYDWGKELNKNHYQPQIENEKQQRKQDQSQRQTFRRTR